jgi:hypothetical protein
MPPSRAGFPGLAELLRLLEELGALFSAILKLAPNSSMLMSDAVR